MVQRRLTGREINPEKSKYLPVNKAVFKVTSTDLSDTPPPRSLLDLYKNIDIIQTRIFLFVF